MSKDQVMLITQVKEQKPEMKPVPVKMDEAVKAAIQEKADLYAEGNLSEWLRFAGQHFVPSKEHLVQKKKKAKK